MLNVTRKKDRNGKGVVYEKRRAATRKAKQKTQEKNDKNTGVE